MNNCLNCKECWKGEVNEIAGYYCTYNRPYKKIKLPLFKGGSKKCECFDPRKSKANINFLTEYPKRNNK